MIFRKNALFFFFFWIIVKIFLLWEDLIYFFISCHNFLLHGIVERSKYFSIISCIEGDSLPTFVCPSILEIPTEALPLKVWISISERNNWSQLSIWFCVIADTKSSDWLFGSHQLPMHDQKVLYGSGRLI